MVSLVVSISQSRYFSFQGWSRSPKTTSSNVSISQSRYFSFQVDGLTNVQYVFVQFQSRNRDTSLFRVSKKKIGVLSACAMFQSRNRDTSLFRLSLRHARPSPCRFQSRNRDTSLFRCKMLGQQTPFSKCFNLAIEILLFSGAVSAVCDP